MFAELFKLLNLHKVFYPYSTVITTNDIIWSLVETYYPAQSTRVDCRAGSFLNLDIMSGRFYPETGFHDMGFHKFFIDSPPVRDGMKYEDSHITIFEKQKGDFNKFKQDILKLHEERVPSPKKKQTISTFMWTCDNMGGFTKSHWSYEKLKEISTGVKFKGANDIVDEVKKTIQNHYDYKKFLLEFNEFKPVNILLHGPPGTGKTTFIKTMADETNSDLYIASFTSNVEIDGNNVIKMLNPYSRYDEDKNIIVACEDIDRYFDTPEKAPDMQQLLNAIDGANTHGHIRIFTANNIEKLQTHKALMDRFIVVEIPLPTTDIIKNRVNDIIAYLKIDITFEDELFETLHDNNWDLRTVDNIFTHLLLKYKLNQVTFTDVVNTINRHIFE